jgi:hypothetical protein
LHLAGCRDLVVGDLSPLGLDVLDRDDLEGARRSAARSTDRAGVARAGRGRRMGWPGVRAGRARVCRVGGVTNALQLTSARARR